MRKFLFTLLLAFIGSVWTIGEAVCLAPDKSDTNPVWTFAGTLQWAGMPCEDGEPCANCLTVVLTTSENTFYLTAADNDVEARIDSVMQAVVSANCICQARVGITGVPYKSGNLDYLSVIRFDSIQIVPSPLRLPSLCDTWNVMVVDNVMCGGCEEYSTDVHVLQNDTVIGGHIYRQLLVYGEYEGALREGDNRDIYCIPAGTTHEYLLYAFNAKAGDVLTNVWLGGSVADSPDGWQMEVVEIQETTPRTFVLNSTSESGLDYGCYWTEGIGLSDGPMGSKRCVGCANSQGYAVLCAYKDGELMYDNPAWDECSYSTEQDTVALYWRVGDGPGSTTVTPVDPNQVIATLNNNLLTIREMSGEEVTYSLVVTPISYAPARHDLPAAQKAVAADTFRNSVAVELSEDGSYTLTLSKTGWENDIYGSFDYTVSGLQPATASDAPARKVLRDGQLLIQQGDKIFTLTGVQTK